MTKPRSCSRIFLWNDGNGWWGPGSWCGWGERELRVIWTLLCYPKLFEIWLFPSLPACPWTIRAMPGEHHGSFLFIMCLYSHFLYVFIHLVWKPCRKPVLSEKMFTVTGKGQQSHSSECQQYHLVQMDILYCLRGKYFNSLFISLFRCLFHIPNNNYNPFSLFLTPASLHILLCLSKCILHLDAHSKTQYEKTTRQRCEGTRGLLLSAFAEAEVTQQLEFVLWAVTCTAVTRILVPSPQWWSAVLALITKRFFVLPKCRVWVAGKEEQLLAAAQGENFQFCWSQTQQKYWIWCLNRTCGLNWGEKPHRKQQKWLWTHLWV